MTATLRLPTLGALVLFALAASFPAWAQPVVVIANRDVQLAGSDVPEVFLGDRQFAGAVKLVPVDNAALQDAFLAKTLGIDSAKYNGKWVKKSFREGLNAPPVKSGDAEVIEFVRRTPGAIGYVGSVPAGVAVIQRY